MTADIQIYLCEHWHSCVSLEVRCRHVWLKKYLEVRTLVYAVTS